MSKTDIKEILWAVCYNTISRKTFPQHYTLWGSKLLFGLKNAISFMMHTYSGHENDVTVWLEKKLTENRGNSSLGMKFEYFHVKKFISKISRKKKIVHKKCNFNGRMQLLYIQKCW